MTRFALLGTAVLLAACGSSTAPSSSPTAAASIAPSSVASATATPCVGTAAAPAPTANQNSGTAVPGLATIQFVTPRQGWVAGRGRILVTADGGTTWTAQYQGPEQITLVDFVSAQDGWAVGGDRLLGTTDGGHCWRTLGEPATPLVSVHFIDPDHGWGIAGAASSAPGPSGLPNTPVIGDGVPVQPSGGQLVTTTDGGGSWTAVAGAPGNDQSVCFSDSLHGWLGAGGRLYHSTDRGATWTQVPGLDGQQGQGGALSLECSGPDSVWLLELSLEGAAGNQPYAAFAATGGGPLVELFEDMYGGGSTRPNPGSYPGPFSVIDATTAAFAGQTPPLPANPVGFEEAAVAGTQVTISHATHVAGVMVPWSAAFLSPTTGWLVAGTNYEAGYSVVLATADGGHTWTRQLRVPA